jgi:hypothetical protein
MSGQAKALNGGGTRLSLRYLATIVSETQSTRSHLAPLRMHGPCKMPHIVANVARHRNPKLTSNNVVGCRHNVPTQAEHKLDLLQSSFNIFISIRFLCLDV